MSSFVEFVFVIIAAFFLLWFLFGRSKNSTNKTNEVNSLISHRKKRVKTGTLSIEMPDVATAHQHESKLKPIPVPEHEFELPPGFKNYKLSKGLKAVSKQKIIDSIQTIRKPHPMLNALASTDPDPKQLYDIVRTDPELVAKVINVANSPLFGLSKPITNVNHAVVYLGVVQVKNIATHFALQETTNFKNEQQRKAYERIWCASFIASNIALLIGKELNFENPAELSTRCQLSYLGDISILFSRATTAKYYLTENLSLYERVKHAKKSVGADAATIGKLLALQWKLPESISQGIANSLLPLTNQLDDTELKEEQIKEILLCYYCCRMADLLVFNQKESIFELTDYHYEHCGIIEFYHFEAQLEQYGMQRLANLIHSAGFKKRIQNIAKETSFT
ncbi:HDOD domain-containing protein [Glaciecola petra]|uniref:HDOD domain-containing protein n=1 Tax=Glaciecola petra TaxID=3075602 RepID=A0ABU2ZQY2_9ALTE|nr:HDOD domain-containing protein [Aestuariibacter sp. P117]MDT0595049.1 HDOD domain-containing protein [Aestuariibacter sp. P117]